MVNRNQNIDNGAGSVTTVSGAVVMHHHPSVQMNQQLHGQGVHSVIATGNGHHLPLQRPNHHHPQSNTILSMAASVLGGEMTSAPQSVRDTNHAAVLMDPSCGLIHPALRGVKTINIGEFRANPFSLLFHFAPLFQLPEWPERGPCWACPVPR